MRNIHTTLLGYSLASVLAGTSAVSASAETTTPQIEEPSRQPEKSTDDWQITLNFPMIWAPDIYGEIDVDGDRTEIEVSIGDILDKLSMGFIGELYVEKGNWGGFFRAMHLATESDARTDSVGIPGRPPLLGKHRIDIDSTLYTADLAGAYRVHPNARLYLGARVTGTTIDLRIKPLEEGAIEIRRKETVADEHLVDWIVGLDLNYRLGQRWSTALQFDTAFAGENDTDLQANVYLSYHFSDRHSLWAGYRYLEIGNKEKNGEQRVETSFTQQGPTLGWAFSF